MCAMEPAPAPTSAMSMAGTFNMYPPALMKRLEVLIPSRNSYSVVRETRPPSTSEAFAVVPPMSNAIRFGVSATCPSRAAPATPAAGPEPTAKTGRSPAPRAPTTPPLEATTRSGASTPIPRRPAVRVAR